MLIVGHRNILESCDKLVGYIYPCRCHGTCTDRDRECHPIVRGEQTPFCPSYAHTHAQSFCAMIWALGILPVVRSGAGLGSSAPS